MSLSYIYKSNHFFNFSHPTGAAARTNVPTKATPMTSSILVRKIALMRPPVARLLVVGEEAATTKLMHAVIAWSTVAMSKAVILPARYEVLHTLHIFTLHTHARQFLVNFSVSHRSLSLFSCFLNRIIFRMRRTASRTNARTSTARTLVNASTTAEANGRRSSRRSARLTGKRCDERQCAIVAFH